MEGIMKKIISIGFLIVLIVLWSLWYFWPYIKPVKLNINWKNPVINEELNAGLNFIDNKLSVETHGIFTNYLDSESVGEETRGHDVLSESEGLIMLFSVEANDKKRFDDALRIVKNKMKLNNNLVSWRYNTKTGDANKASALLDDLRIAKALILASDRWKSFEYRREAIGIMNGIMKYSTRGTVLVDFNDSINKSDTITMCYLDVYGLNLLSKIDPEFNKIKNNAYQLLNDAYLGERLPLYRKSYNLINKSFSNEEECETLLSMLVVLYKSEDRQNVYDLTSWLNKRIDKDGAIYTKYSISTGEPATNVESTAIYAVGAQIAKKINNEQLYTRMITLMNKYQIKNKGSEMYGAFGFEETKEIYSFDNLQAILALITAEEN